MRRFLIALALALASPLPAADFPDYLVIRDHLGGSPRDNGGGRMETQALLARIVDASGATVFEELHCDVRVVGADAEVELALGSVDPARNPLDLRFDGRWTVRVIACDEAACVDGIPDDPLRCNGEVLLDKPLQVVAYAWRAKHASQADRALFADDCDRLDGLDSTDFMPAGTDEWVNDTGDTMTGPLMLPADPTQDLEAATKKYVDEQIRSAIPRGYAILGPSLVSPPGFAPSGAHIATDGEWETLAPLPSPAAATAVTLDGKIYARTEVGIVQVYDSATNSWSPTNGPGSGQAIVALDGSLHLLGLRSVREHWERPAGSPFWRPRAPVPDDRVHGVVVSSGRLYATTQDMGNRYSLWAWEPGSDLWQRVTGSPPYTGRALVDFQGAIWAIGGSEQGSAGPTTRVDIFDPAIGYWTQGPPIKRRRWMASAAVLDGRIYVLAGEDLGSGGGWGGGGSGYGDNGSDSVEVFDPATSTWSVLPSRVPTTLHVRAAIALDGRLHVVGGGQEYDLYARNTTDAHEALTPQQRWYVHVKQ